jgi:hypothetical protein
MGLAKASPIFLLGLGKIRLLMTTELWRENTHIECLRRFYKEKRKGLIPKSLFNDFWDNPEIYLFML